MYTVQLYIDLTTNQSPRRLVLSVASDEKVKGFESRIFHLFQIYSKLNITSVKAIYPRVYSLHYSFISICVYIWFRYQYYTGNYLHLSPLPPKRLVSLFLISLLIP